MHCEGECNKECLSKQETKEPTIITDWLNKHGDPEIYKKVEKQLELEEAAINFYREFPSNPLDKPEWHYNRDVNCFKKRKAFINGAKYMAEKMYSEEEVYELLLKHQSAYRSAVRNTSPLDWSFDIKDWFENFKKK
jgi:hypothetical protein